MALTGIHVVCAPVATRVDASLPNSAPEWSRTLSSPGTTDVASSTDGSIFQVSAGVDAFFAVGASPVATNASGAGSGARYYLSAGSTREVFAKSGDKVAWTTA